MMRKIDLGVEKRENTHAECKATQTDLLTYYQLKNYQELQQPIIYFRFDIKL